MRGDPSISPIYHQANDDPPEGEEAERRNLAARKAMWRDKGLLVVDPEDELDDFLRQYLINMGNKLYGRRGRANGK